MRRESENDQIFLIQKTENFNLIKKFMKLKYHLFQINKNCKQVKEQNEERSVRVLPDCNVGK